MTTMVVVPRWGDASEEERIVRPLVSVLASREHVDLLALEAAEQHDDVGDPAPVVLGPLVPRTAAMAVARRAISMSAAAAGRSRDWLPEPARTALTGHLPVSWDRALAHMERTSPSAVVVCGADTGSALPLFRRIDVRARKIVLPLVAHHRTPLSDAAITACRAATARLAIDEAERSWLERATGARWTAAGTALDLPPVDSHELPDGLSPGEYVAVIDAMCTAPGWRGTREGSGSVQATLQASGWLAAAITTPVVALHTGDLIQWHDGRPDRQPLSGQQRDAVVAYAAVVVTADPTSSLGWGQLVALARGRPVATLEGMPGASYVTESGGGIVSCDLLGLRDSVRELLEDPGLAGPIGKAGAAWAEVHAGSEELYARRLAAAGAIGST